jgi:hypothetical protein
MTEVVQATCVNGDLILEAKLSSQLEGQKVDVTVRPLSESTQKLKRRVSEAQIQSFFEEAKQFSAKLPPGYKFDQEELHER